MTVIVGLVVDDGILVCSDESERRDGVLSATRAYKIRPVRNDGLVGYAGDVTHSRDIDAVFTAYLNGAAGGSLSFESVFKELVKIYDDAVVSRFTRQHLNGVDITLHELLSGSTKIPEETARQLRRNLYNVDKEFGVEVFVGGYNHSSKGFEVGAIIPGNPEDEIKYQRLLPEKYIAIGSGRIEVHNYLRDYFEHRKDLEGVIDRATGAQALLKAMDIARKRGKALGLSHLTHSDCRSPPTKYRTEITSMLTRLSRYRDSGRLQGFKDRDIDRIFRSGITDETKPDQLFDNFIEELRSKKRDGKRAPKLKGQEAEMLKRLFFNIDL